MGRSRVREKKSARVGDDGWGRGRTSAAARTRSASNSATAAMNALVCSMAFMTFSFLASSRALIFAALVALDSAPIPPRGLHEKSEAGRISRAAAEVERDKLSIRRHTEVRDYTVVRIDPTTVDVRRSLQSPRRRRRGAAHSPSPSRLPREGASRARDPMSHSLGDRASAMLFHFQTPTTVV